MTTATLGESDGGMRYGIVGCGRVHRNHAQAARLLEDVELVGVADLDEGRLAASADEWGVPGYKDYRELVASGVDAIGVCLPHHLHADVCIDLADAGVHVLCEKPLATSIEDADRIIAACDRNGVQLGVVFQHRFNENSQVLRRLLDEGRLGTPVLGTATFQYHKSPADSSYFGWRGTWESAGGGTLNNHAVHTIDLLCWLLGSVKEVQGFVATLTLDTEVEDTGVAILRFEQGALATVAATISSSTTFESRICIAGTEGSAVLTDSRMLEVEYLNGLRDTHRFEGRFDDSGFDTAPAYGRGHIGQLADFALAVKEGRPPLSDGRSARELLATIKEIYDKARS